MARLVQRFKAKTFSLLSDERAATSIEYALIAVIISISIAAAVAVVGHKTSDNINVAAQALSNAQQ